MNGKYLATNLEPLKAISDGKVLAEINDLFNTIPFKNTELVAYSISDSSRSVLFVDCLFAKKINNNSQFIYFRDFTYYKKSETVEDNLKSMAEHGVGFLDINAERFLKLRDFYERKAVVEATQ